MFYSVDTLKTSPCETASQIGPEGLCQELRLGARICRHFYQQNQVSLNIKMLLLIKEKSDIPVNSI